MFKNLVVFDILPEWTVSFQALEAGASAFAFAPCEPTQPKSIGFTAPRGERNGSMVESVGGQWMLKAMIEKRMLPGSVVKRYLEERVNRIWEQTGRKIGKRERAELKEEITRELLPKVLAKQECVQIWINPVLRLLCIDAGSKSKVDDVLTLLVKAIENFGAMRCATNASPAASMGEWLKEAGPPEGFSVDDECELRTPDETKSAVRYSRHNLDLAEIRQHLEHGKLPTRMALTWQGRVSFVMSDEMQLKKLSLLDVVMSEAGGGDNDPFDADVAITTGELSKLIPDLVEALGGRSQPGGVDQSSTAEEYEETSEGVAA